MNEWTRWLPKVQLGWLLLAGAGIAAFRLSILPWRPALLIVAVAVGGLTLVGFAGFIIMYARFRSGRRGGMRPCLLAVGFSLPPLAAVLFFGMQGAGLPPIHDITTDMVDPPAFVAAVRARSAGDNSPGYAGLATAEQQRTAYADISPLFLVEPPERAFSRCLDAAASLGWEVLDQNRYEGRIEAVARTAIFRFADDVVIRVRSEGAGSRIDIRSASRAGVGDLGVNAERIRTFIGLLKAAEERERQ